MAQTGYTPILIYSSSTTTNAPAAGSLTNSTLGSELAINITDGKLFYKDNANAVQVIGWKTTPTTAGGTGLTSYTAGDLVYYATGTALSKLAIGTSGQWLGSSGSAPQWNSPAALTKTDDTNVTLTLGGSASTALLNAASLTLGWTGQLAASRGGTGIGTYTAGDLLYASGTTTLSKLAIGTANYVLTSSGSAPQWTAGSSVSVGTASNLLSNATSGVMQIVGPAASTTRVMTIPNANFTVARTDAGQTFTGNQTINGILDVIYGTGDQLLINAKTNDSTAANNAGIGLRANSSATAGSRFAQLWFDADGGNLSGGDYFLMTKNGNDGTIDLIQYSNSAMRFAANYIGRATIDMTLFPSGGVSIGNTTDPGAKNLSVDAIWIGQTSGPNGNVLDVKAAGEVSALNRNTAADGVIIRYQKQGSTVGYISTNTYSLPSDERIKKNIVPISLGLEFVLDLEPVEYNTIFQDPQNESRKNFGLKAQQVEAALQKHGKTVNDVTFLEKFEEYKEGESQYGLGYQNLVPVLIQAVHQLQAQIDELKGARNVAN